MALARYRRTPCHDGYELLDEIAASKPAGNTSASPARTPARPCQHAPTGTRARAGGVRAQTNTRPRVRAFLPRPRIRLQADTHAATCAHAPTHARACTPKHARTRTHQWLSRPWMATTRLTSLPRHRYVYTSNVDGHFRRHRQSHAQSVVRGAVPSVRPRGSACSSTATLVP